MTPENYIKLANGASVTNHAIRIFISNSVFLGLLYLFGVSVSFMSIIHYLYVLAVWSIFLSYLSIHLKIYHLKSALATILLAGLCWGVIMVS